MTTSLVSQININPRGDSNIQNYAIARLRANVMELAWKNGVLKPDTPFMVVFKKPVLTEKENLATLTVRLEITDMADYVGIDWGIEKQDPEGLDEWPTD